MYSSIGHSITLAAQTLPEQSRVIDSLVGAEVFFAAALAIIGVLLILFGFKAYRWIVVFNCVALGFWLGGLLGELGPRAPFFAAAALAAINFLYGVFVLPESLPKERRRPFKLSRANPLGTFTHARQSPVAISS